MSESEVGNGPSEKKRKLYEKNGKTTDDDESNTKISKDDEVEKEKCDDLNGFVLYTGTANWDNPEQKNAAPKKAVKGKNAKAVVDDTNYAPNVWEPMLLGAPLFQVRAKAVITGGNAVHCFVITVDGKVFGFGRNKFGQLGLGEPSDEVVAPKQVTFFDNLDIVEIACGRAHTLFRSRDGKVWACGDNKFGQLGQGQRVDKLATPSLVSVDAAKQVACGADFCCVLDTSGDLWTWGHPEFGQLGLGMSSTQICKGATKIVFDIRAKPEKICEFLIEEDSRGGQSGAKHGLTGIKFVQVACATNHTVAMDVQNRVWTWGTGTLGRLGHNCTRDESRPRLVNFFVTTRRPVEAVYAGGSYNFAVTKGSGTFMWGQMRSNADANMYPKSFNDLDGWEVHQISCGMSSCAVLADDDAISWGNMGKGELGYGPKGGKTSARPQVVETLKKASCKQVAMGYAQCLYLAQADTKEDQQKLEKSYPIYER